MHRQETGDEEYELQELDDDLSASVNTRLADLKIGLRSQSSGIIVYRHVWNKVIIPSRSRKYQIWVYVVLLWAAYSSFVTPMEFGFYRGLPKELFWIDLMTQFVFIIDIVVNFFIAYKDPQTYKWVVEHRSIAIRYAKQDLIFDILSCIPWDIVYKASGRKEPVRCLMWIRLYRVRKVEAFFRRKERDTNINYLFTRIVKLLTVELYCTHTAACIFYYLATTLPPSREGLTWIGSLKLGDYDFTNFRDIDLGRRYIVSLYFAIITMATVGYGDIHAVNTREMVFVILFVSFDMVLGAYLIGNMTALIVKGSKTEKFRDKMKILMQFMNKNKLAKDIRSQLKSHLRLQYESQFTEDSVVQDLPLSIRAKVARSLYLSTIQHVLLFQNCSSEFINQIARRVKEEYFLPGEIIIEEGSAADQIYFVASGSLVEFVSSIDGSEEVVSNLEVQSVFGEVSVLCGVRQPYNVRVSDLCKVLRIEKDDFFEVMEMHYTDGRQVLTNLLKFKSDTSIIQHETDIAFLIAEKEMELSLRVNNAAYHGKTSHFKSLIKSGADPNWADYDGRRPLHLAAAKGHEDVVIFLLREGADFNAEDNFGSTPLIEAMKGGHTQVIKILRNAGAIFTEPNTGDHLRNAVWNGNLDFVKALMENGVNPNSADRDGRTALHIAASQGMSMMTKLLIEYGADIYRKDRWGFTPIHESRRFNRGASKDLLEIARKFTKRNTSDDKSVLKGNASIVLGISDLEEGSGSGDGDALGNCGDSTSTFDVERRCTVLADGKRFGLVVRIPDTVDELLQLASQHFGCTYNHVTNQDDAEILDTKLIRDSEKIFVVL